MHGPPRRRRSIHHGVSRSGLNLTTWENPLFSAFDLAYTVFNETISSHVHLFR